MTGLAAIPYGYGRWIDTVSNTAADSLAGFSSPRVVTLVEDDNGALVLPEKDQFHGVLQSGQLRLTEDNLIDTGTPPGATDLSGWHVELVLRPDRFLIRPLELPARAAEFLDGIVRAQIDRLTPWNSGDATFGWSVPVPQDDDRIVIMVAAAARESIDPYAQGLADLGAGSIAVFVQLSNEESSNDRIKVLDQRPGTIVDAKRLRHLLSTGLVAATIVATLSIGAMWLADSYVSARQDDIARKIGSARAALMASGKSSFEPHRVLERRKNEVAPSVIVLDAVSQILPDDTYVTALEIEGDKVRISGVTRDAPPLIALMERSNRFARATFFAPTTRSPSDRGERFHIEANIQPLQPSP